MSFIFAQAEFKKVFLFQKPSPNAPGNHPRSNRTVLVTAKRGCIFPPPPTNSKKNHSGFWGKGLNGLLIIKPGGFGCEREQPAGLFKKEPKSFGNYDGGW
ncbi:MAG: hypothetical protein A2557_10025 [Candidatus Lambdaproteobacteria bacterium RIFOXYD2_FULL_56_26]|uniref:Uncharacterized protein n=1 Tax=Candidatus Lambdaproteobacteria bacterium RIFOXYD2_FULL_56_26 TaxID=1817773 RepID=A0A1F6GLU1_9PROT|nr:MAG: hypothetical protein A2557_10025 [Candidatus Lambdaproteobacteria bacterium RIFOXYD2_FULL_56_26]OGH01471.1 MAG: hypothetical protein A2426_08810 [Candidatus Lambdaproteobacteria bacterium RIFOXYC1_FULL_56_13]